jgi:DnaJ-domain-containing protein 1
MSIGRRLFNLAKSELNSLLDRAVEAEQVVAHGRDPDEDLYRRFSLDELTDKELEAEIERRHRVRQAKARGASTGSRPAGAAEGAKPTDKDAPASARASTAAQARKPSPDDELRRAYAALEVPFGSDFAAVRKSYRVLMRKYHPDRHAGSPEKQKAATELAQKLSAAYQLIEQRTSKRP